MKNTFPLAVQKHLVRLGLTKNEITILNVLFEHDCLSLAEILNETLMSNSSIRLALGSLLKKGIVERRQINNKNYFAFPSKKRIEAWIIDKQEESLESFEKAKNVLTGFLMPFPSPKIEYFNGVEGVRLAHLKLLEAKNIIRSYLNMGKILEYYPTYKIEFIAEVVKRNLHFQTIMSKKIKDIYQQLCPKENLEIRFLDIDYEIESRLSIFDDQVLILLCGKNPSASLLQDENLYKFFLEKFEYDWQRAEKKE